MPLALHVHTDLRIVTRSEMMNAKRSRKHESVETDSAMQLEFG
jgi:hypothetical protein